MNMVSTIGMKKNIEMPSKFVMVLRLLCYLFLPYQEEGNIPEYIGYYV